MEAADDRRTAEQQLTAAQQERDTGERRCNEIDARLTEYKNHDAIKKQDGLKELRERVSTERTGIAGSARHLNRAQESLATLKGRRTAPSNGTTNCAKLPPGTPTASWMRRAVAAS
ncbi:hypothetical protein NKH18_47655 [Streptomyces sp. M10(2022)]